MPQTEQVAEFVQTLGTFYELVEEGSVVESIKGVEGQNGSAVFNGGEGLIVTGQISKIKSNG